MRSAAEFNLDPGRINILRGGRTLRNLGEDSRALIGTDLDQEPVPVGAEPLGEGEVIPWPDGWPGAHGRAEADPAGFGAVDRDDERAALATGVGRIGVRAAREHGVEDPDGGQVAAPHTQKGVARRVIRLHRVRAVRPGRPQPLPRRVQELLPRLGTGGVREDRVVLARAEPVVAGCHVNAPPGR